MGADAAEVDISLRTQWGSGLLSCITIGKTMLRRITRWQLQATKGGIPRCAYARQQVSAGPDAKLAPTAF